MLNDGANATGPTTTAAWSDWIFASADDELSADDQLLATVPHDGTLANGESYNATTTIQLPSDTADPVYLFVVTDATEKVDEFLFEDNNVSDAAIITPLAPDIELDAVRAPANALFGDVIELVYRVENVGSGSSGELH